MKGARSLLLPTALLVIVFAASLAWGSIQWQDIITQPSLLWELRGARALLAIAVGGALAVSGALLQVLFSNPLCEPYTLGISSGAALGAVLAGSFGAHWVIEGVALGSLGGAVLFMLPLAMLASRREVSGQSLLLAGVMLGFFGSSLVALVMALSASSGVAQALVWLLGDLSRASTAGSLLSIALTILATGWVLRRHAELDTLLLGERPARAVGVEVDGLRREVLAISSLLVAVGVATSGMIGFVGLMVPHLVRRQVGSLHLKVLPLCVLWGAVTVLVSDLLGRMLFAPREIPVGVITALVGAPLYFFWLRGRPRHG
jgi:ABC-type Fe3+-siderophore transport system permease subunit